MKVGSVEFDPVVGIVDRNELTRTNTLNVIRQDLEILSTQALHYHEFVSLSELVDSKQHFVFITCSLIDSDFDQINDMIGRHSITCPIIMLHPNWTTDLLKKGVNTFPSNTYFTSVSLRSGFVRDILEREHKRLGISSPTSDFPFRVTTDESESQPYIRIRKRLFSQFSLSNPSSGNNSEGDSSSGETSSSSTISSTSSSSHQETVQKPRNTANSIRMVVGRTGAERELRVLYLSDSVEAEKYFKSVYFPGTLLSSLLPECADKIAEFLASSRGVRDSTITIPSSAGSPIEYHVSVYPLSVSLKKYIGSPAYVAMGNRIIKDSEGRAVMPKGVIFLQPGQNRPDSARSY